MCILPPRIVTILSKKETFFDIHEAVSNSFYRMVEKVTLLCPLSLDTNIIKFTISFRAKLYGECLTGVECKLNLRV